MLLQSLSGEMRSKHSECESTTGLLDVKVEKVEVLELNVGLLVDKAGNVGEMQQQLHAQERELDSTKRMLEARKADVREKTHDFGLLKLVQKSARAATSRGERLMRNFA